MKKILVAFICILYFAACVPAHQGQAPPTPPGAPAPPPPPPHP